MESCITYPGDQGKANMTIVFAPLNYMAQSSLDAYTSLWPHHLVLLYLFYLLN